MAQYIERAKVTDALIDNTSIVGDLLVEAVNAICDIPAEDVRLAARGEWRKLAKLDASLFAPLATRLFHTKQDIALTAGLI